MLVLPLMQIIATAERGIKNRGLGAYVIVLIGIASDINKIVNKLKFVKLLPIHFGFSRARNDAYIPSENSQNLVGRSR